MEICTIASGSSGNAMLVSCGGSRVLLDAGISARRITTALRELGVAPGELDAVLITHEHSDHIAGLATLSKQLRLPVYASAATARQLCCRIPFLEELVRPVEPDAGFQLGALWARAFATPHDAAGSVGYTLEDGACRMALATDLGHLTQAVWQAVLGADLVVAECNHDEDWVRSGPYPYYLKQRILGDRGHLCNEAGAELAARAVERGARAVLLAHLSTENNTPVRALDTVSRRLSAAGVEEGDVHVSVAPRSQPGPVFRLERDGLAVMERREAVVC